MEYRRTDGWRTTPFPRVEVNGKHLHLAGDRFVVKGVTYGSFVAREDGARFPDTNMIHADMAAMATMGLNTVRVYDVPPPDLVAAAAEKGLRLLIGLDYCDWRFEPEPRRGAGRAVLAAGCEAVDRLARAEIDPGMILGVSVGNEMPSELVRVHGRAQVEDVLSRIVERVHHVDDQLLTTYTNYPSTEYLDVEGQDFASFNVFLENHESFERYLRHLQVASSSLPLVLTELGLPSEVHGAEAQAEALASQLEIVDRTGCAGATVFAWTDEWGVEGLQVGGWGFGLTDENRLPKPAFQVVKEWASSSIKDLRSEWPLVSVVVCAYNEEATIEECLESLERSDYPDLEVLMCDDGSTDDTLALARRFPFRIIELPHGGLSQARNAGIEAASGEIVAFLDADAMCHPQWPWFLALAFDDSEVKAAGGPNLPVPGAGMVERAVALSPGSPTEVLVADDRAEHIAGCNMAFRRAAITEIDMFDPAYTSAGDDVDVCWKLLDRGYEIGFSPGAQVIHHRRGSVRGYLKQQRGYGRAEKLLSGAHPARFNQLGQARWSGFIYGGVGLLPRMLRPVVYHGHQGSAPFQPISVHRSKLTLSWVTALMPAAAAAGLALTAGAVFSPWFLIAPLVTALVLMLFATSVAFSVKPERTEPQPLRLRALVGALHVAQPIVRTWGRLRAKPHRVERTSTRWDGTRSWWLHDLERRLRSARLGVIYPGSSSTWDIAVPALGMFRVMATVGVAAHWTAHLRRSVRPTALALATALMTAITLAASTTLGTAMVIAATLWFAGALWRVRSIVSILVDTSTLYAEPSNNEPSNNEPSNNEPSNESGHDEGVADSEIGLSDSAGMTEGPVGEHR